MKILPVIHYIDTDTAIQQVALARQCGADGVFLIDHHGNDDNLVQVAALAKEVFNDFPIGINLLSYSATQAARAAIEHGFQMVWADSMDVDSAGLRSMGRELRGMAAEHPKIGFFASVAFKYQAEEPYPSTAARYAREAGFVPTTSGTKTGTPPTVEKIKKMSAAAGGMLAVASGMTPDNIALYAPYLSHVLVSTGVSIDDYRFDKAKLVQLISMSR
jgi:predicted TIM-barrel enzyme